MKLLSIVGLLILCISISCKGDTGPTGPPGLDGVANTVVLRQTIDNDGKARALLPIEVGIDPLQPPAVTTYITRDPLAPLTHWSIVSDGDVGGRTWAFTSFYQDRWYAQISNAEPGLIVAFVTTY